ncbi:MAG TPA: hypothetical protein VIA62_08960 [Thermoanaerobaculia bacterium]|jgi:hypothetical protein|nr:hypothetical protein [Thermoanaerobaculia bacterium]
MRSLLFGVALCLLSPGLTAGQAPSATPAPTAAPPTLATGWEPLAFLVGDWEGTGTGAPGASKGGFSFEPQIQGNGLLRRSTNDSPSGHHEDVMLVYRNPGGAFRAVYVDNERHVIQYAVTATAEPRGAVFLSDEAAGMPRFRLTYKLRPDGTVGITFELAPPGSAVFKTYTEGTAKRR